MWKTSASYGGLVPFTNIHVSTSTQQRCTSNTGFVYELMWDSIRDFKNCPLNSGRLLDHLMREFLFF